MSGRSVVLVGGGDARDHATFRRLRADGADVRYVLFETATAGNALLRREPGVVGADSVDGALEAAAGFGPDLVVVQRPELLIDGVADAFRTAGHEVLGVGAELARLEASKSVGKRLLTECGVPTPDSFLAADAEEAGRYLRARWRAGEREYVVKSDRYLSDASLRTTVPASLDDALRAVARLDAAEPHRAVLLEERVHGHELSLHLLLDGRSLRACPLVSDYKTLDDDDSGPNTHGMGAVAVAAAPSALARQLDERVVQPLGRVLRGDYRGVLYVGVVVTRDGPQVLELNVRPGNPEWIALLPLLESPLDALFTGMACGGLADSPPRWRRDGVAGVAFATVPGYPGEHPPATGVVVLPTQWPAGVSVVGEGIAEAGNGLAAGAGRSLAVVAVAPTVAQMRGRLYEALDHVDFSGMHYRRDIGWKRAMITDSDSVGEVTEPADIDHAGILRELAGLADRAEAVARVTALTETLIEQTGKGLQLGEAGLDGLDLSRFDLRRAQLNRAQLYGADLSGADLREASLICPALERTKFTGANLRGAYVHAFAAQVCDFRGADLSGITDGTGSLFHGCHFQGAVLSGSMLSGSSFYQTNFDGATLAGANLQGCQFLECSAVAVSLEKAQLDECSFTRVDLTRAVFTGASGANVVVQRPFGTDGLCLSWANLPGLRMVEVRGSGVRADGLRARSADLRDCTLTAAEFSDADLADSSLVRVSAAGARFDRVIADNSRWLSCAMEGAGFAGMRAENWAVVECGFARATMTGIQMRCASVRNSVLTEADLTDAYLYRAMITGDPPVTMDLQRATLTNAVLVQAYLAANLSGADLRNVRLAYGRLNQATLAGADLRGSALFECSLIKTDFTDARLAGVAPPVLADRCPGLEEALAECTDADAKALLEQVTVLKAALSRSARRST